MKAPKLNKETLRPLQTVQKPPKVKKMIPMTVKTPMPMKPGGMKQKKMMK